MSAILPPVCPLCGDPTGWRSGLVFHDKWIHYKEAVTHAQGESWRMLATIVERLPTPPQPPAPPRHRAREYQHEVLEIG